VKAAIVVHILICDGITFPYKKNVICTPFSEARSKNYLYWSLLVKCNIHVSHTHNSPGVALVEEKLLHMAAKQVQ